MVKGQTPFGTPPTDSDLIDSPSGFATLESFQRDIDRDRIAAIARSHTGDDYGGDFGAAGRRRSNRDDDAGPDAPPSTIDGSWRPETEARTAAPDDPRSSGAESRSTATRAADVRHHRRSLPPPTESIPLQRAARRAKRTRQGWVFALTTVIVVILLAACGAVSWFLLRDNANHTAAPPQQQPSGGASDSASEQPDRLAARDTDATPLTDAELFGRTELAAGNGRYRVLKTEVLARCDTAASKTMGPHLADSDCSQVVRATVADASGEHAATVGVVNLTDTDAAADLRKDIEDGSGGAFNALRASGPSKDLGLNPTVLGFNTFGHYLLYAVIGRADGKSPSKQDEDVSQIVADLVDVYLVEALEPRGE